MKYLIALLITIFSVPALGWKLPQARRHNSGYVLHLEDDILMSFGGTRAAPDCWIEWDTTGTDGWEFKCTDVDGGGTDGSIFRISTGTDDVVFSGTLSVPKSTGQYRFAGGTFVDDANANGALCLNNATGTTDICLDAGTADDWLILRDGSNAGYSGMQLGKFFLYSENPTLFVDMDALNNGTESAIELENGGSIVLGSTSTFDFASDANPADNGTDKDLGLARDAAGVLKVTNGSTGLGDIRAGGTIGIPLERFRTHDAMITPLPGAAASDDFGFTDDISAAMSLVGVAASGASQTQYGGVMVKLPARYIAGSTVKDRVRAKVSADATASQQVDVNAYVLGDDDAISVDLCETAAQTITNAYVNYDFTIDDDASGEALGPGDVLQIRIGTIINDTGGAVGSIGSIVEVKLILST